MGDGYFLYTSDNVEENYALNDIETVYKKMDDELSKDFFINRLLYSMTLDMKFIRKIIVNTEIGHKFLELLHSLTKNYPILIYGAGRCGVQLVEIFSDIKWSGFIDEHKTGSVRGINIKKIKLNVIYHYPQMHKLHH